MRKRRVNERVYEAELLRLEGELARSNNTEAHLCPALLERAVESAQRQSAHLFELRALTSLARAWQAEPRATGLLQRLSVVLEQLTLQCDGADAREARSLLRESQRNPATIP